MTQRLEAIFEDGVFKPAQPVTLAEGTRVQVIVESPAWHENARTMAETVAAIAASEPPRAETEDTSENVDKVLFGEGYGR